MFSVDWLPSSSFRPSIRVLSRCIIKCLALSVWLFVCVFLMRRRHPSLPCAFPSALSVSFHISGTLLPILLSASFLFSAFFFFCNVCSFRFAFFFSSSLFPCCSVITAKCTVKVWKWSRTIVHIKKETSLQKKKKQKDVTPKKNPAYSSPCVNHFE
jgi:hypothetical protein